MSDRALLTAAERDVLARRKGDREYRTTVRTRLRQRVNSLETDLEILAEHEPDLLERVRVVVC